MADINIPKPSLTSFLSKIADQKAGTAVSKADSAVNTFKTSGIIGKIDDSFLDVEKTESFFSNLFNKGSSVDYRA